MAAYRWLWLVGVLCFPFVGALEKPTVVILHEDNWQDMLEGEWLVEFFAPWCPACKGLAETWKRVAGWSDDLGIKVAQVDVTDNPGLSGRFMVTALPTIYHVKDGVFRQYRGPRDENDFVSFVDDKKWKDLDPVPWYTAPNSIQMSTVSLFFKASMVIRAVHNKMTTDYGIPEWGSYIIFALATIVAGLLLGLVLVICCDFIFPPKPPIVPESLKAAYRGPQTDGPVSGHGAAAAENNEEIDNESDIVEDDRKDAQTESEEKSATRKRRPKATTD